MSKNRYASIKRTLTVIFIVILEVALARGFYLLLFR
jgi:hypothetical protein